MKLFLKAERCYTDKCGVTRRSYPPGQHGQGRIKQSEYCIQLREKQKIRRVYGVLERQFRGYFEKAERMKGITGDNLLQLLERRFDNIVQRMGFAGSKKEARQLVRHGHMLVNGKKVNIPAYLLKAGDVVELREKSRGIAQIQQTLTALEKRASRPGWRSTRRCLRVKCWHCRPEMNRRCPQSKNSWWSNSILSNVTAEGEKIMRTTGSRHGSGAFARR